MPVELRVPADKSIAHRAIVLAALARGTSRIGGATDAADVASTIGAMRALGARIDRTGAEWRVEGGPDRLRGAGGTLDCGNSGTTARFMMGVCSALRGTTLLDGDDSLRRRPMERVAAPLRAVGARIESAAGGVLPVRIEGSALRPIHHRAEVASAQVKSALLLAGLVAGVDAVVEEPVRSRDHTERMMRAMGASLEVREEPGSASVRLRADRPLEPLDIVLPGDFSSAAFLVAGALLAGVPTVIRDVGLNPTRTGFLDIARRMGARIHTMNERESGGEPIGDLFVEPSGLTATDVSGADSVRAIDELPLVGVLAAHARGRTRVTDAAELRVKESDRIRALCANLAATGVAAAELPDGFEVQGGDAPLRGYAQAYGDHRIAMGFAVLGLRPGSRIDVDDMDIARVSFPGFERLIDPLRAGRARGGAA